MNAALPLFATATKTEKAQNVLAAARAMVPHLARSRTLDRKLVSNIMTTCFGATDAEGAWNWRDAYDAAEAALVLQMRRLAPQIGRVEDAPAQIAALLQALSNLTPTHTRRSEEQVALDQFSTPPALAALAVAAAQVRPGDLVLEPSAGTGLLAIVAQTCGAKLELNEISEHRASILDGLFADAARTRHDGALLPDLLPSSGSFHAAVTNPPFQVLDAHLKATLRCLAIGGRMSAIVPARALEDVSIIKGLSRIGEVIAAVRFPDNAFYKHGTGVDSGLLVVDRRVEPTEWTGSVRECSSLAEVAEAISTLPARSNVQPRAFQTVSNVALLTPKARELATPSNRLALLSTTARLEYGIRDWTGEGRQVGIFQSYSVGRVALAKENPHPSPLVESGPMASVPLPAPTYRPTLPERLIRDGLISDAQMETIIYAGEAHSAMLPGWWKVDEENPFSVSLVKEGAEGAVQFRRGFFLGDGTGCGKGRQAASTAAESMANGRLRAVWVSKNDTLLEDARRDWCAIGGTATDVTPQSAWKQGEKIRMDRGILFTTYATLRQPARGAKASRLAQIVEWLGANFDGVIIFDEAHAAANAAGGAGNRGKKAASQQGMAVLALQNLLPNARVLYVSATGATTPENLAYAARLGLWGGPEAPFENREQFLEAVDAGGVAVMELIARELKAMGLYIARSLSCDGVEYEALHHDLTDENIAVWDAWADAFQVIHANLREALEHVGIESDEGGRSSGAAKSAVLSVFEGAKIRFFGHLLAGMKTPTIIQRVRQVLADGQSAVLQIVSTNEAVMERRLAEVPPEEWNNLAVDLTPKEYVLDYLKGAFPVNLMREIEDDDGNKRLEPVMQDGVPVLSQEALRLRDELLVRLACLPAVPGVLDGVIDALGADQVAEVTGRSRRVVNRDGRRVVERRGSSANKAESDAFMSGRKRVLIFSDAGGTGRSYHADLAAANQQRRVHLLIEPGWRADNAIQGLGRTHRTNQASAPLFQPVTTNIQGEKRFLSTISRRLDAMGALTRGDRRSAGNGLFRAEDNLESPWARQALQVFYANLVWGSVECMTREEFETKTGLTLLTAEGSLKKAEDLPPMNTFLNRVLALRIADQNVVFRDFTTILNSILERAAASGSLDRGVEDIVADEIQLVSEEVIRTDAVTGAETRLVAFDIKTEREIRQSSDVRKGLDPNAIELVVNKRSGGAAVVAKGLTMTDDNDRLVESVRIIRPTKTSNSPASVYAESAWEVVDEAPWLATWDAEVATTDKYHTRQITLITGLLLPLWTKLPRSQTYVRRITSPDGRRWLGRVLDDRAADQLRIALGLTTAAKAASDAPKTMARVLDGDVSLQLAGDKWVRRVRVMDRYRLELVNVSYHERPGLHVMGCFTEIIAHTPRMFMPTDQPVVFTKVLEHWPVVDFHSERAAA
ncbi:bifunctional class I SAM-dependent methyltransferase/DEAD/DEAH box helicase [Caulobacter sp. 17J65-9]|uniref:bifunctional class I SAM-dependent methyltransferase/DEAD/DEAH box helicase n=1 Tax=Caulobacter sp. 17J65-9 TaxID=2709382 RepID=UPI0013CBD287|nr:bifunctional class I SAM-dependent methyltransferase/DEAD/DEAH box helicase [Caulobacter sp. 17J65-9]NEX91165.1 DEAD/DEAH box helicase family protein [Caulobacter sp. 17J65-9]